MQPKLSDLRDQADEILARAAAWLGVSVGHLWNCENGLAHLTPEQDAALRSYYLVRISERIKHLSDSLAMDADTTGSRDR